MGVCTREWNGKTAEVLMATPCTNSLGGGTGGHMHVAKSHTLSFSLCGKGYLFV